MLSFLQRPEDMVLQSVRTRWVFLWKVSRSSVLCVLCGLFYYSIAHGVLFCLFLFQGRVSVCNSLAVQELAL